MNRTLVLPLALLSSIAAVPAAAEESPLANLCLPAGVVDRAICLENGRWEGEPSAPGGARPMVQLVPALGVAVDLDADGVPEQAGMVAENAGGSGSTMHLVLARREGDTPRAIGTALVGDRVQIRDLTATGPKLLLSVIRHGGDDAPCCPTQKADLVYVLGQKGLVRVEQRARGTISLADLQGVTWRLSRLAWNEPAPAAPEVTLTFAAEGISGSSGCNQFTGTIREPQPRTIEVGPLAGTRRLCQAPENELEGRVLDALGKATSYSFLGGELLLAGNDGKGGVSTIYFVPSR